MLGGTAILITPEFDINLEDTVMCDFQGEKFSGDVLSSNQVLCVSPLMQKSEPVQLSLLIGNEERLAAQAQFLSRKNCDAYTYIS